MSNQKISIEDFNKSPFVIGVSGGTSAGKTSVCKKIVELLEESFTTEWHPQVSILHQDSFLKPLTKQEKTLATKWCYNFDHPDSYDTELMKVSLTDIINRKAVKVTKYNFNDHDRKSSYTMFPRCDVVLFEGIFIFYHREIRDMFNMKLFVDSDADTRLSRRVVRDVERGQTLESILHQYTTFIKPAFEEFCLPSKKYADVIIPRGTDNKVAINLIVQHIQDFLRGNLVGQQSSGKSKAIETKKKAMGRLH